MLKVFKVLTISAAIFFTATIANAQFGGPGGPGGPGTPGGGGTPVPGSGGAVPFDGGLSIILIAAGAGIAKKKNLIKN